MFHEHRLLGKSQIAGQQTGHVFGGTGQVVRRMVDGVAHGGDAWHDAENRVYAQVIQLIDTPMLPASATTVQSGDACLTARATPIGVLPYCV